MANAPYDDLKGSEQEVHKGTDQTGFLDDLEVFGRHNELRVDLALLHHFGEMVIPVFTGMTAEVLGQSLICNNLLRVTLVIPCLGVWVNGISSAMVVLLVSQTGLFRVILLMNRR